MSDTHSNAHPIRVPIPPTSGEIGTPFVFATAGYLQLQRVDAAGGTPVPVPMQTDEHPGLRVAAPQALADAFSGVAAAYIADGHHRAAAAAWARAATTRRHPCYMKVR